MPNRPELYKRSSGERYEREYESADKNFYQSYQWRKFRADLLKKRRREDYQRAYNLHSSSNSIALHELMGYIASDLPLCEECYNAGTLASGPVADHRLPIRLGGAKFDPQNVGFLCHRHHQEKRGRERTQHNG
jgi:hypothetical protein